MTPIGKILAGALLFGFVICILAEGGKKDYRKYKGKYHHKGNYTKKIKEIFGEERTDVPDFCHKRACPKFQVVESNEDYEVRDYEASKWLVINTSSDFASRRKMFRTMFNYLKGNNSANETVPMGIPVLKKIVPGEDYPMNMMFYMSKPNPPTPNDSRLYFVDFPAQRVFVRVFGGYARPDVVEENRQILIEAVGEANVNTDFHYTGSFNAPWIRVNRHNEVWMMPSN